MSILVTLGPLRRYGLDRYNGLTTAGVKADERLSARSGLSGLERNAVGPLHEHHYNDDGLLSLT